MPRRALYSADHAQHAHLVWSLLCNVARSRSECADGRKARLRALLSVANREGITGFARDLLDLGVEIYATDGTREHLANDGVQVGSVSELTSVPALIAGQVKTFHPAVYAG